MARNFLFSVIIAVCNAERTLPVTIDSIIEQTFGFEDSIEIIVVNDASSDGTGEVAKSYARLYPDNIRVFNKSYGGIASARNVGLRMATGDYINFCEAGGYFDDGVFASVAVFLEAEKENTSLVAISGQKEEYLTDDFFDVFKRTRVIELHRTPGFYQPELGAYFITREACSLLSFDETVGEFSGVEFIYRILAKKDATIGVIERRKYISGEKPEISERSVSYLLNEYLPKILRYYRDRYDPPLPRYFLTMVMRLFCDIFAGSVRQMNLNIDQRKVILNGMRPILSILNENMLRGDRHISENALAFCLSMQPNPQEFLKDNYPEFDGCYSVTAVMPLDGDEDLLVSLRQSHCEGLEVLRSDRNVALQKAKGDFIVFFEKDDRVDADFFRIMLRRLALDRVSVCCCSYRDKQGKETYATGLDGLVTPAVAASASLPLSSFMFKTAFLRNRVVLETISSSNPYFYLSVLRKTELAVVKSVHITTNYKEERSIDQIFGDSLQRSIDPLASCYDEYNKVKHFSRLL